MIQENIRYYIASFTPTPKQVNHYVRQHWSIEGTLHWHLDVSFNEDNSKTKKGNAPENLNILRKIAEWDDQYPLKILQNFKIRCD